MYTSLTLEDVKNLTIPQYQDLITTITSKQAWDLQMFASVMTGEINEELNPLHALKDEDEEPKRMTLEDVQQLTSMM